MMVWRTRSTTTTKALVLFSAMGLACSGENGSNGTNGEDGTSCSIADNSDGTKTITCEDGTSAVVSDGSAGTSCSVSEVDGVKTISCEDGTSVTVTDGAPAPVEAPVANEACSLCHGPGRSADLAVMHGLEPHPLAAQEESMTAVITDAVVNGTAVEVSFSVANQDDEPVVGISANSVRFTLAYLAEPDGAGNGSRWQNYFSGVETREAGDPGTAPDNNTRTQGTYQRATDGTLVDNSDGSYLYIFGDGSGGDFDITAVTTPIAITYDETLTHRVGIQFAGLPVPNNPTYDWRPSDGATSGISSRSMVKTATCNSCHQQLAFHGGGRRDVEFCVTCHNPGSGDAHSDESVDFTQMVHRIHRGRHLPSVEAGGEFIIWGYRNSPHNYSEVGFPQNGPACTKCHDPDDADTPDAANFMNFPTAEACGSCHDDLDFATGANHVGGPRGNDECAGCHGPTAIASAHTPDDLAASVDFAYEVINADYDSGTGVVTIDFRVFDPIAGTNYDILTDPEFTETTGVSRLGVIVGWNTADYTNEGSGQQVGQPITINPLTVGFGAAPATNNGDDTFRVSTTLPAQAVGTGVVAIEGHPAGFDGTAYSLRVPVRSALAYFAITDSSVMPRRQAVSLTDRCDNCHGSLSMHGANRTDEGQVCVICHNPNATDVRRRPDDHTDVATLTADGKKEASIDFKHMVHAIHAAGKREEPYVVWGYGNNEHVFGAEEVTFPGVLSQCDTCHVGQAYTLPLAPGVLGTTVDSAPGAETKADADAGMLSDPHDDANISPTAAVCSACHDSAVAKAHMEHNGAGFGVLQEDIQNP